MASSAHSEKQLIAKPIIRLPDTIEEAVALKRWAEAQDDRPQPASILQVTKHLTFLAATLPSKAIDDETGKMRVAVYSRILGEFSNDALAYMARKACETLDWFPTPRQCLEILQGYRAPVTERSEALSLCHRFWQGRFEEFIFDLKNRAISQEAVDTVPLQWRKIAMEQGYLRYRPDEDRYVIFVPKAVAIEAQA
ncbi:MAG: hypothetical protein ACSLE1_03035 [Sphingobium sp.]